MSTALTPIEAVNSALQLREENLSGLLKGTGVSVMQFKQDILLALQKTPKLQDCTALSIVEAGLECAQLGLRPGGTLGHVALVPYGKIAKLVVMYQGKIELALRSQLVTSIKTGSVYENDSFEYEEGSVPLLRHKRLLSGDRGKLIAAYAMAFFPDGTNLFQIVDHADAMDARSKSQGYNYAVSQNKDNPDHPWHRNEAEMWKKTAIHRLGKLLPKSPALRAFEEKGGETVEDEEPPTWEVSARPADDKAPAKANAAQAKPASGQVTGSDGKVVDTATGEVVGFQVTEALWDVARKARIKAEMTPEALGEAMKGAGMSTNPSGLSEKQYNQVFELIEAFAQGGQASINL